MISPVQPEPSAIDLALNHARELTRNRRYAEALAVAQTLATQAAATHTDRDVMYLIAANQRCLNHIEAALATLRQLELRHPRYSRLFQERGYCFVALRDARQAIDAFQRAVNINPALTQSWSMLERLYGMTSDSRNAALAAEQVATLTRLPLEIVRAGSLFSDGDPTAAENLVRSYLRQFGDHAEGLRLLARIEHQRLGLDEAERLLGAALALAPDYHAARMDYIRVLIDGQKHRQARDELEALLNSDPTNREYQSLQATACAGLGEHGRAIDSYRQLLVATPDSPDLHLSLAHSLKTAGHANAAIESYRAAAVGRPGEAYWSLANLKTYRFSQDEIARMRTKEAAPTTRPADRCYLCFALGKAFEDEGLFAQSWHYYEQGNALKRSESLYRAQMSETNTQQQIEVCTQGFFAARAGAGAPDPDPIFIVGLPRSGSTLVEQILASHSLVEGTHELPDIARIVRELQGRDDAGYPAVLAKLAPEDFLQLGERYLADTRTYRRNSGQPEIGQPQMGQPFFIDKMPNNFRHLGLIHLMLPNATVIDVRREPMACCFSNLKQLFASGQDFTYSIEDIARYYRTYLELMRHWNQTLPGRVLRVHYEDVVDDLEGNVRRILEFCGLEYEPACVGFHNTQRSVRTASSEQVRQPIFRESLHQWRNYEPWLGPLEDALGDALTGYRD